MKLFETYDIGQHFLTSIFYDDTSGISEEDEKQLNEWMQDLPECPTFSAVGTEAEFAMCCVSGLMADTVKLEVWEQ